MDGGVVGVVDHPWTVKILFDVADAYVHFWLLQERSKHEEKPSVFADLACSDAIGEQPRPDSHRDSRSVELAGLQNLVSIIYVLSPW